MNRGDGESISSGLIFQKRLVLELIYVSVVGLSLREVHRSYEANTITPNVPGLKCGNWSINQLTGK